MVSVGIIFVVVVVVVVEEAAPRITSVCIVEILDCIHLVTPILS